MPEYRFTGLLMEPADLVLCVDDERFDPRLRAVVLDFGLYANRCNLLLKVTGMLRSRARNIEIYGHDRPSGHRCLPCRAIDFSVKDLPEKFIIDAVRRFNIYFKQAPYWSLIRHNVGAGDHLHMQVPTLYGITKDLTKEE
jgi:hypothetical protein